MLRSSSKSLGNHAVSPGEEKESLEACVLENITEY